MAGTTEDTGAMKSKEASGGKHAIPVRSVLRLPAGRVDLARLDPGALPGFPGKGKDDAAALVAELAPVLSDLVERLHADGRVNPDTARSILLVLQGMDTAGKSGVIRHMISMVDPEAVAVTPFRTPTAEESSHPFLWRIRRALPRPGMVAIFDRSHYEDVLVARVDRLVPSETIDARYAEINEFERELVDDGVILIKCFLHISREEQRKRLADRLRNPDKNWKYDPGDVDVRAKWDAYMEAYRIMLERCSTDIAPWFVVPSDNEWYRNWAVGELLREHLKALHLGWPKAPYDVAAEERRLAES